MQRIDKILDEAIERIRKGENPSAVVSDYPASVQNQLNSLLEITSAISSLPRKQAPAPTKRRLYLQHQRQHSPAFVFFHSFRMLAGVLGSLILLIAGTAVGAARSLPGDTLFTLKKGYENIQVSLTTNPEQRANLQLEIADQRLADAQKVLSQNNSDNSQAAIEELSKQTVVALNDVKAAVNPAAPNSAIIQKAESIAKSQSNLVAKADPQNAQQANQPTQVALHDLKQLIATSNEASSTSIPAADINVSGKISAVQTADQSNNQTNSIKVDNNIYVINDSTEISDSANNILTFVDLKIGDQVKITGKTQDKDNIAGSIVVTVQPKEEPKPKTPATQAPPSNPSQSDSSNTAVQTQAAAPTPPPIPAKPKDTFGGYIAEPVVDLNK